MRNSTILITGANGEIGHGLISHLAQHTSANIVAIDLHPLDKRLRKMCGDTIAGDILDSALLETLSTAHDFDTIVHLAALLSTRAERQPTLAHRVNVDGTINLLEIAITQSRQQGREVKFIYPSSIAVYGLPNLDTKKSAGKIGESQWCEPRTMYGINKLYCEQLGRYYSRHYRQLDAETFHGSVDFRALRFPGLISATTLPTGGTSDFAPEMLHSAAQNKPYACFAREDTRIPFLAMPDAIHAIVTLTNAVRSKLNRQVYNVTSFSPTAIEIFETIRPSFPSLSVRFSSDAKRQQILDSWPEDTDDSAARHDWNWQPRYDMDRAFHEYLIPAVIQRYE